MLFLATAIAAGFDHGPFETGHKTFKVDAMDSTDRTVDVFFPKNLTRQVPLISYVHGAGGGGSIDSIAYIPPLEALASFGFVVLSPRACNIGCSLLHNCKTLFGDPPCYGNFYKQQLLALEWAKNESSSAGTGTAHDLLSIVNHTLGYGVAGHSMGGQATLFSSSFGNASANHIKAAVMQHAFSNSQYPTPTVPFLAFTGTDDDLAPASMAHKFFDKAVKAGSPAQRGLVNKVGAGHLEPIFWNNEKLPKFTAAWFKLYLEGVQSQDGFDYVSMIYGTDGTSLCSGGDGKMSECVVAPQRQQDAVETQ